MKGKKEQDALIFFRSTVQKIRQFVKDSGGKLNYWNDEKREMAGVTYCADGFCRFYIKESKFEHLKLCIRTQIDHPIKKLNWFWRNDLNRKQILQVLLNPRIHKEDL